MQDICPYTCILEECANPDTLFVTRNEWMEHFQKDHQRCWECLPCAMPGKPSIVFTSVKDLIDHTQQRHGNTISNDQYSTLLLNSARPAPTGISQCPLCDFTGPADSDPLLDHITEHLHSFSLRSLPWPKDEFTDPGDKRGDYFNYNDYFDDYSEDLSHQVYVFDESDRESDGLASFSSDSSAAGPHIYDEDDVPKALLLPRVVDPHSCIEFGNYGPEVIEGPLIISIDEDDDPIRLQQSTLLFSMSRKLLGYTAETYRTTAYRKSSQAQAAYDEKMAKRKLLSIEAAKEKGITLKGVMSRILGRKSQPAENPPPYTTRDLP